jgi:3-isopropylmalate/(R)-2-methylmalate dehydratase small subunit
MPIFESFHSPFILLDREHIDTDQIIPARFLKQIGREGLSNALFHDWRYDEAGRTITEHILNKPDKAGIAILVAGSNFGCGSSREHAVWALVDYGFRVVVSPLISDIFKSNALKNGLLPIEVSLEFYDILLENPDSLLEVDLYDQVLQTESGPTYHFAIDPFARHCLLQGVDQLGYLVQQGAKVDAFEKRIRR